jgi:hypothetical protein
MRTPCKGCESRHIGCHSECEKYREYAAEYAAYREHKIANGVADDYLAVIAARSRRKWQRRAK